MSNVIHVNFTPIWESNETPNQILASMAGMPIPSLGGKRFFDLTGESYDDN